MKNRILFLLFLLIPVCLLVWFAYQAQSNEQLAAQQHYQNLAHSQLKRIDEKIANYFKQLESALMARNLQLKITQKPLDNEQYTNKIRKFLKHSPYILNVYIAAQDQKTIYPSAAQQLSEQEQQFLSRIQVISNNQSLFNEQYELRPANSRFETVSQKLSQLSRSSQERSDTSIDKHGWIAWYQQRNLHHLFWFKDEQQMLYLLYLDRIRILSELINLLPESNRSISGQTSAALQDTTIRLTDSNNELIYEWGNYPVKDNQAISMMLSYPLSSWKISWYAKALSEESFTQKWSLLIIAVMASILMVIIIFIIYREYNREIRQAQQRVNFVSQVSHELKTPLTNIRMYAELLETKIASLNQQEPAQEQSREQFQEQSQEQSKSQHFLNVIINESQRLSRLIENVLSFSKAQKNTLEINRSEGFIDECIENVLLSFKPVLQQKHLSVQFNKGAGAPVLFDAQLLEQILNNLFSNIEKYAAQGKQIDISSSQSARETTIEIRDYGPGIAIKEQQKIFEPFYRSHSKLTEGVSGTGIGLAISQQLAILHGGHLSYKNVPQGACFVIQIETLRQRKSKREIKEKS